MQKSREYPAISRDMMVASAKHVVQNLTRNLRRGNGSVYGVQISVDISHIKRWVGGWSGQRSMTLAQAPEGRQQRTAGEAPAAREDQGTPIPPETNSVTKHDWTAGGHTIHYTATAGNLLIRDDENKPNGSIFYVAYTEDGAERRTRPVTFFYNGGPGSATIWLHMGSVGPVRVVTQSPEATGPAPFEWVQNQYSLLDKSDLVFIDAPLCGFSRAVGKGTAKDFAGVDQDMKAFEKFITRYITVNQRWNSPKFLFGETYGTTRSAALVAALKNDGIEFNGVMLLSSILNYAVVLSGTGHRGDRLSAVLCGDRLVLQEGDADGSHGGVGAEGARVCARAICRGAAAGRQAAAGAVRCDCAKVAAFTGLSWSM